MQGLSTLGFLVTYIAGIYYFQTTKRNIGGASEQMNQNMHFPNRVFGCKDI